MDQKKQFAIVKINASKYEFAGFELMASFDSLEKAQEELRRNEKFETVGDGWRDSYKFDVFELKDGKYFKLDGELFDPEFGDRIV